MSVHLRIENHVATVTLARPDVLNAVDLATEAALQRIWTEIEGRDDVRVVVLTGEGERAFCVGADLKNPTTTGLEYWGAARPGGFGGIALRETLNVPVVARSTVSRWAAASRWCWAATSWWPARKPVSACRRRWWAACRWTAA